LTPPRKDDPVEKYMSAAKENRSDIILAYDEMLLTQRQADLYEIQKEITNYSTLADKQETLQSAEEAAITYDAAVQEVEGEINEAYKQLVALRGVTGYYESQLKTAQDNYDRSQSLYEMGMATAASVDQVRMSLTQAKMQLENNMIDIWQQRQKLEIISGIGPGGI
jgi:outer membrane protein TolC